MKLYGVIHGLGPNYLGFGIHDEPTHPSFGLLDDLEKLPNHTKVGVEFFSELCQNGHIVKNTVNIDGKEMDLMQSARSYWERILKTCEEKKLDVVYLDDMKSLVEHSRLVVKLLKLEKEMGELEEKPKDEQVKKEIERLNGEIFLVDTEFNYVHQVKRERKILKKIQKARPEVVLVGAGHGDVFFSQRGELAKKGIAIDSYARENVISDMFNPQLGTANILDREASPDEDILSSIGYVRRAYFAVKFGRVVPQKTPQFIGTWRVKMPDYGLFEVYVSKRDGERLEGYIEDPFGEASFKGRFTGKTVSFVKEYDDSAAEIGGSSIPLSYQGTYKNGKYEGTFCSSEQSGDFWMRRFNRRDRLHTLHWFLASIGGI